MILVVVKTRNPPANKRISKHLKTVSLKLHHTLTVGTTFVRVSVARAARNMQQTFVDLHASARCALLRRPRKPGRLKENETPRKKKRKRKPIAGYEFREWHSLMKRHPCPNNPMGLGLIFGGSGTYCKYKNWVEKEKRQHKKKKKRKEKKKKKIESLISTFFTHISLWSILGNYSKFYLSQRYYKKLSAIVLKQLQFKTCIRIPLLSPKLILILNLIRGR
jgi:hypothetical protein